MNKSLEAEEWEKEQKFIVVAFFLGIPYWLLGVFCFLDLLILEETLFLI